MACLVQFNCAFLHMQPAHEHIPRMLTSGMVSRTAATSNPLVWQYDVPSLLPRPRVYASCTDLCSLLLLPHNGLRAGGRGNWRVGRAWGRWPT